MNPANMDGDEPMQVEDAAATRPPLADRKATSTAIRTICGKKLFEKATPPGFDPHFWAVEACVHLKGAKAFTGKDYAGVQMMLQNSASEIGRTLLFDEVKLAHTHIFITHSSAHAPHLSTTLHTPDFWHVLACSCSCSLACHGRAHSLHTAAHSACNRFAHIFLCTLSLCTHLHHTPFTHPFYTLPPTHHIHLDAPASCASLLDAHDLSCSCMCATSGH